LPRTAENVAAPNHDRRLHAERVHFLELARNRLNRFAVNAESLRSLKRLPGKLQQNPAVSRRRFLGTFLDCFLGALLDCLLLSWHESPIRAI
jgi:hypothetical protein